MQTCPGTPSPRATTVTVIIPRVFLLQVQPPQKAADTKLPHPDPCGEQGPQNPFQGAASHEGGQDVCSCLSPRAGSAADSVNN